ncbi:hypothetical protein SLUN_01070 [Streptomyces lunaelactis]|uniref:Uncharacterized protein n=1 Tax=Streptomyces lunaelactis TaxID=1535768 RepID=A0A2R4SVZ8_9ACTN|nr:hypothetical protein [Streptomyces lunaelactis]AVZ71050.1 hypothetical protein SLUN_01070 [Streptomyces lunaelactis]NUK25449.1 hypothetical protein [Streptomyces lunaelactis]NUK87291.1 hypothetical protein [Streptomyces lunaelactis]
MNPLRLRALVTRLPDDISVSLAAQALLGQAVQAEVMMDTLIASRLGRSTYEVLLLQSKAICQLSINAKLGLLQEILEAERWDDDFPFVLPVLRALFTLRNKLAHSLPYEFDGADQGELTANLWSSRRGAVKIEQVSLATMVGLVHSAQHVTQVDMQFLHVRALPEEYWTAE